MRAEREAELIVELGSLFADALRKDFAGWKKAFFLYVGAEGQRRLNGSAVTPGGVELLRLNRPEYELMGDAGRGLQELLGAGQLAFLLVLEADLTCEIDYEYRDLGRWHITKLGGGTGIPEGHQA